MELPFKQTQRELVVKALQEIRHTGGSTSSVTGARLAIQVTSTKSCCCPEPEFGVAVLAPGLA